MKERGDSSCKRPTFECDDTQKRELAFSNRMKKDCVANKSSYPIWIVKVELGFALNGEGRPEDPKICKSPRETETEKFLEIGISSDKTSQKRE